LLAAGCAGLGGQRLACLAHHHWPAELERCLLGLVLVQQPGDALPMSQLVVGLALHPGPEPQNHCQPVDHHATTE
jgi:hypothetical protein